MSKEQKQSLTAEEALLAEVLGDTLELRNQVKGLKPELEDATHKLMKAAAILIDASEKHSRNGELIKKDLSKHAASVVTLAKQELAKIQTFTPTVVDQKEPQPKSPHWLHITLLILVAVNIMVNVISLFLK
jgi:hypothetical protein